MAAPLNKREFDVFLSHAHADQAFVSLVDHWLTEKAGLSVYYDARELSGGALLATDLQGAIERCRGILLFATAESVERGWVKAEYNSAMDQRANYQDFRVVLIRVEKANVKDIMKGTTWIEISQPILDSETALSIVRAFYPGEKLPNPSSARDVYISCSWRPNENASARAVSAGLADQGFRLIGDAKDQQGFGAGNRVEKIIASCGAFVGIIPFREIEEVRADGGPYQYFLRELDFANQLGLPAIVVADPRLKRGDGQDGHWLRMPTEAGESPQSVVSALNGLWDDWQAPPKLQYIFYAMDLASAAAAHSGPIRHLIERITGMPTIIGTEVDGQSLHLEIMKKICDAFLVLADITDDNVNACVEAGMGIVAGTNVRLIARGRSRNPPFMLRGAGQLLGYADELELIGILHKLLRPFRRRIINAEL
jgi:TIR domain